MKRLEFALFINMFPTALVRPLTVCNTCILQASSLSVTVFYMSVYGVNVKSLYDKLCDLVQIAFITAKFLSIVKNPAD